MLERMVQAMRSMDYEGTFVYLHEDRLEAMQILHTVEDGQEREQLISLNGSTREVIRDRQFVACMSPGTRTIAVDKRGIAQDLWRTLPIDSDTLTDHYLLHPLGSVRVADRQTDVVGIIPRDAYRYGYRFYLDRETGLPLKTDLMDEAARPIEQIMFTRLNLEPRQEPKAMFHSPPESTWQAKPAASPREAVRNANRWQFGPLPAGFELIVHDNWQDEKGAPVEHFLLSDGLASVSVYVEPDTQEGLDGGSRMGATNAWGGVVSGFRVTAVGEVPEATVREVVHAMELMSEVAQQ
jgi:sigma-E factor negative regulatory protein RseB